MEIIKTNFSFESRRNSCSFSSFSKNISQKGLFHQNSNEEEFNFEASSLNKFEISNFAFLKQPNETRKFSPQIIISSSSTKASSIRNSTDEIQFFKFDSKMKQKKGTVNRADCIRKRIKTHFNQYLLKMLNKKINKYYENVSLGKLSQRFIADVKIESNKFFISLPVKNVFSQEFKGSKNFSSNKKLMESIEKSENIDLIEYFNRSYGDFFNEYLESEIYKNDLRKFHRKEGENYAYLFKKYSIELLEYYKKGFLIKEDEAQIYAKARFRLFNESNEITI